MWQRLMVSIGILLAGTITSQAQWNLAKVENRVKVYTSESGSSNVKSVRVVATVDGTI
jgi:hypothetical protein